MDAIRFDIRLKLVLIGIVAAILLFLPTAVQGANNVVSNTTQNSTSFTTTATWTEIVGSNRTITTGTGNTSIIVSIASRINLSGKVLYARVMRDGSEIGRYNITASPFESSTAFMVVQEETAGIHQYGLEVYSTAGSQATVYRWSMTVLYLLTGEYLGSVAGYITNTSAQITAGQVTGLPGTLNLMNGSAETNDTYRQNNDSSIRAAMALQNQSNEANNTYRQNNDTATRNAMTLQNQSQDTNNTAFKNTFVLMNSSSESNNTASQSRDDLINSTKVNKSGDNMTGNLLPDMNGTRHLGNSTTGRWGIGYFNYLWGDLSNATGISMPQISLLNTILNLMNQSQDVNNTAFKGALNLMNGSSEVNDTYRQTNDTSIRNTLTSMNSTTANNDTYRQNNESSIRASMTLQNQSQDVNNTAFKGALTLMNQSQDANNTAFKATFTLMNQSGATNDSYRQTNDTAIYAYVNGTFFKIANATSCTGGTNRTNFNGSWFTCEVDQTSAFSITPLGGTAISGALLFGVDSSITLSQNGNWMNLTVPGAGVTNATVDPQHFNFSNGTSGNADSYLYVRNITINFTSRDNITGTINLTSGADVRGLLPDGNLASTFVKTVSATTPCTSTGGQNPSITCSGLVTNATVDPYNTNASNITGVLPNVSIPLAAANKSTANTFSTTQKINSDAGGNALDLVGRSGDNISIIRYLKNNTAVMGSVYWGDNGFNLETLGSGTGDILCYSGTIVKVNTGSQTTCAPSAKKYKNISGNYIDNQVNFSKLNPIVFRYTDKNIDTFGFAANAVAVLYPQIVYTHYKGNGTPVSLILNQTNPDEADAILYSDGTVSDIEGINYEMFSAILISRVQQQQKQIDDLEARVQKLEDRGILDIMFAKQINYLYTKFNLTKP